MNRRGFMRVVVAGVAMLSGGRLAARAPAAAPLVAEEYDAYNCHDGWRGDVWVDGRPVNNAVRVCPAEGVVEVYRTDENGQYVLNDGCYLCFDERRGEVGYRLWRGNECVEGGRMG